MLSLDIHYSFFIIILLRERREGGGIKGGGGNTKGDVKTHRIKQNKGNSD